MLNVFFSNFMRGKLKLPLVHELTFGAINQLSGGHYRGAVGEDFQRAGTEKVHREGIHSKWLPPFSLCIHLRKVFTLKVDCIV